MKRSSNLVMFSLLSFNAITKLIFSPKSRYGFVTEINIICPDFNNRITPSSQFHCTIFTYVRYLSSIAFFVNFEIDTVRRLVEMTCDVCTFCNFLIYLNILISFSQKLEGLLFNVFLLVKLLITNTQISCKGVGLFRCFVRRLGWNYFATSILFALII